MNVLISGDDGNDTIDSLGTGSTLTGGIGDDSIENAGSNSIIDGGAGDDYINIADGSNLVKYSSGDGNDVITDFNSSMDKIRVLSGEVKNPDVDSLGDVTFAVGDGQIVIKNGAKQYIPIYDGYKNILSKYNPR